MPSSQLVSPVPPVVADPSGRSVAGEPPAHTAAPQAVLDAVALARLAELDPKGEMQLIERVMKTFQASAVKFTAQLASARAVDDRAAIRLVAHTLKSSSGYIGALQLARCCAELEAASTLVAGKDLAPAIDAMIAALEATLDAIARRLDPR